MGEAENQALVERFLAAWQRADPEELATYFTDDAVYHNMPEPQPMQGREAIEAFFRTNLPPGIQASFEILNIATRGDVVLTERVDNFALRDRTASIPVMGAFEIRDGRIAIWRDYFDLQTLTAQIAPSPSPNG